MSAKRKRIRRAWFWIFRPGDRPPAICQQQETGHWRVEIAGRFVGMVGSRESARRLVAAIDGGDDA
jgi:hypothetical protein